MFEDLFGTVVTAVDDEDSDFEPIERPTLPFLMTLRERTRHRRVALDTDIGSIAEDARSEVERESDVSVDSDLDVDEADRVDSLRASARLEEDIDNENGRPSGRKKGCKYVE